jgi:hypothetical protein
MILAGSQCCICEYSVDVIHCRNDGCQVGCTMREIECSVLQDLLSEVSVGVDKCVCTAMSQPCHKP